MIKEKVEQLIKEKINIHQLIYSILGQFIQKEIHAVILKTYTIEEFENL